MQFSISLITYLTKIAIVILLVVMLSGCNGNTGNTGKAASTPIASPVGSSSRQLHSLFNSAASADIMYSSHIKLHVQTDGIDCGGAVVVLKKMQPTYDLGVVKQINTFLNAFYNATVGDAKQYSSQLATQLPALPETIQVVPIGDGCFADYAVTNIGDESVQISAMGITLTGPIVKNTIAYQSIDDCTLPTPLSVCRCTECGSGGGCAAAVTLYVDLPLNDITKKHLDAPATICNGSSTILGPHQLLDILLNMNGKTNNIYYDVNPTITLTSVNGTGENTILNLPPLFSSTLVFSDQSHFSCYGFNGKTFVIDWSKKLRICI